MNIDIQIDGEDEREFRRSIEEMLRAGDADAAAARIKALLPGCCGEGKVLPARFLTVTPADVEVAGWDQLADRIARLGRPEHPITAIGIDISNSCHNGGTPDADGTLDPYIETNFYSDTSFPFSRCDRSALLDGYSTYGSEWQGAFEDIDGTVDLRGIADLYGAVESLAADITPSLPATPEEQQAYALGTSYIAVLAHIAVRDTIARQGLPCPLAVLVGSNENYPYFDAPVTAFLADGAEAEEPVARLPAHDEDDEEAEEADEAEAFAEPGETASLLTIRRPSPPLAAMPADAVHGNVSANSAPVSGSQLRRTLAATDHQRAPAGGLRGLMGRLLGRV